MNYKLRRLVRVKGCSSPGTLFQISTTFTCSSAAFSYPFCLLCLDARLLMLVIVLSNHYLLRSYYILSLSLQLRSTSFLLHQRASANRYVGTSIVLWTLASLPFRARNFRVWRMTEVHAINVRNFFAFPID